MFSKWKILNNLYDSGAHITVPNFTTEFGGVVDAVAQWKDRTYKLGYDFTEVTRTGYDFIGWKSMAQGIVVKTTSPNITVKANKTNASCTIFLFILFAPFLLLWFLHLTKRSWNYILLNHRY